MQNHTTVAAIATPPGEGGIAVIRISGPAAYEVAGRVFRPADARRDVLRARGYTAMYGNLVDGQTPLDEGVALFFRAPHSYTGEDVVELSCHGGTLASGAVLAACFAGGAHPAQAGEFTKRAVLNGRMSLTQAEAVMDVITASSRQGLAMAKQALSGSIQRRLQPLMRDLVELAGHLAAYIDYPEEDVEALTPQSFLQVAEGAAATLAQLVEQSRSGMAVKHGVYTAIIGSPNVGKSTLFNLLAGYDRAIVTPQAGTTRDVVCEQVNLGEVTLQLADTAGLHEAQDSIEAEGIKRSYDEIEKASLVLAVLDGSAYTEREARELAALCEGKPAICVVNKSDLGLMVDLAGLRNLFSEVVVLSARDADGIIALQEAVVRLCKMGNYNEETTVLINQRQLSAALSAKDALQRACGTLRGGLTLDAAGVYLQEAVEFLAALTGESASAAIIEDVFSRFCVGK